MIARMARTHYEAVRLLRPLAMPPWEELADQDKDIAIEFMRAALAETLAVKPVVMDEAPQRAGLDVGSFTAAECWRVIVNAVLDEGRA